MAETSGLKDNPTDTLPQSEVERGSAIIADVVARKPGSSRPSVDALTARRKEIIQGQIHGEPRYSRPALTGPRQWLARLAAGVEKLTSSLNSE